MRVENWGLISYPEATKRQLDLVQNFKSDTLVICTHPPIVTLGRGSDKSDINDWAGETAETSRGGRATYHGPSQIVIYPIIDLNSESRQRVPKRDLHGYLRALEDAVVLALKSLELNAEARTAKQGEDSPSLTGVWVGSQKVASIGIAVKSWITYHGVAINVEQDSAAFRGINPCGFNTSVMTSVEELLDKKVDRKAFVSEIERSFVSLLS